MKVLWLGRIIPIPQDSGDRIYSAELAGAIARNGAIVEYFGLNNPDSATVDVNELEPKVTWNVVPGSPRYKGLALLSRLPLVAARFATSAYKRCIRRALRASHYDVIVLDQYALVWALPIVSKLKAGAVVAHIAHDFETHLSSDIAQQFKGSFAIKVALLLNHLKTRSAEVALAKASDIVVCLTKEDACSFIDIDHNHKSIVLSPGYSGTKDHEMWSFDSERRVVIVGSFHWIAKQMNLEAFMRDAHPILARAGVRLSVAGSIPSDVKERWARKFPDVDFLGYVPDILDALRGAAFGLSIDQIGGGFKLKTLDYIFAGVPVAALRSTLNGIPDSVSMNFLIADDSIELANRIAATAANETLLHSMREKALNAAGKVFDWDNNALRFIDLIAEVRRTSST